MTDDERTELRERLVDLTGWKRVEPTPKSIKFFDPYWKKEIDGADIADICHSYPDGDLNSLSAAWPESILLCITFISGYCKVVSHIRGENIEFFDDNEYDARLKATVKVLEASR